MEAWWARVKFGVLHMLQEEISLVFIVTGILFWILANSLAASSKTTREAVLSRRLAWLSLALAPLVLILGRFF